jgi:hypothetical protein
MRFRPAAVLDDLREEALPDLENLARRVGRLVPNWGNPGKFYALRDDIADDLHRLACWGQEGRQKDTKTRPRASAPSMRERRLAVFVRFQAREIDRLQALLATAARPPPRRRRRSPDARQLARPL